MSFYLITPADWNPCIRQAATKALATTRAAVEFPGREIEVALLGPSQLDALRAKGMVLPPAARALVRSWRETATSKAAKDRTAGADKARARRAAAEARRQERETESALKAEARAAAQKARDAAKREANRRARREALRVLAVAAAAPWFSEQGDEWDGATARW